MSTDTQQAPSNTVTGGAPDAGEVGSGGRRE